MQSENVNELAAALAKAQGEITGALKDSTNPFFKSKYADLASCWDACRSQLSKNELAVIQTTEYDEGGLHVVTTLAHSSGQWIKGRLLVKVKDDTPQAQGSGLTYARRYALAAMVGLAQIDDDAESAQGRGAEPSRDSKGAAKVTREANSYVTRVLEMVNKGNDRGLRDVLEEVKQAGPEFRASVWSGLPGNVQNYIRDNMKESA